MNNNGLGNLFIFLFFGLIQYVNFFVVVGLFGNFWNLWDMNLDILNSILVV